LTVQASIRGEPEGFPGSFLRILGLILLVDRFEQQEEGEREVWGEGRHLSRAVLAVSCPNKIPFMQISKKNQTKT
jgi:hypothetical protein